MLIYPQLATGSIAQFPLKRTIARRSIVNECMDGSTIRLADPDASTVRWDLMYRGLSDDERARLETFFATTQGRLITFIFPDPTDNLLAESDSLGASIWAKDGLLGLTAAITDPFGGSLAVRLSNSGAAVQGISQTVGTPEAFQYCLSVYARSTTNSALTLRIRGVADETATSKDLTAEWTRCACSGALTGDAMQVTFALELPAGAVVEVYGVQAEPQVNPSAYKMTTLKGGVYAHARFDMDQITFVSEAPNSHDTEIRVVSKAGD
jgi:hypothetical protein